MSVLILALALMNTFPNLSGPQSSPCENGAEPTWNERAIVTSQQLTPGSLRMTPGWGWVEWGWGFGLPEAGAPASGQSGREIVACLGCPVGS